MFFFHMRYSRGTANDHMKNLHEELVLMLDKEYVLEVIFLLTQVGVQ